MGKEKRQKEEKPGKRKKKSHRLYALVVLLLGIAIIALGVLILFYVQKIEISGNADCTDQEIADTVQSDKYTVYSGKIRAGIWRAAPMSGKHGSWT